MSFVRLPSLCRCPAVTLVLVLASCGGASPRSAVEVRPKARTPPTSVQTASAPAASREPPAFFALLAERARSLAAAAPAPSHAIELPASLRDLDYDAYRSIRFKPERSLWRGQPGRFEAQFFHIGFYYHEPVGIFVVQRNVASPFSFSSELFSYGLVPRPPADAQLGFAGLRLHAPINSESYRDEVIVFQGASYFRSLGRSEVYGLSARGLAIDLGEPRPEEFPRFSEFYLVKPGATDGFIWVLALLESPRATGAYAFRIEPSTTTTIDVAARIFLREPVKVLGIAPLTSMYLFGEDEPARFGDFRPEVHDSDGLALWNETGEWLWRPLRNPPRTTLCSFRLDSPRGFGLLQRDRNFSSYQDLEAHYQDRPSAWVEPVGDWGKGALRLLEIASGREINDNIAIVWVPDTVPKDGLDIRYRLHLGPDIPGTKPAGQAVATRIARSKRGARFLVDFAGSSLAAHERGVHVEVTATGGRVIEQHAEANPFANGWRASFEVARDNPKQDVELRAFLRADAEVLTETWSYLWQPKP